ncbi:High-affinity branched-chain amino acid transport system permease protein LivH [Paraconexibacter sp. AEG42_29]|uniref:High-affinity branched-chain amino acid transport system permease protein LivH n=1 Tax=Paraconexibacter sp. AEG42_29 TaxID=2997339 RepID=A0AAU7AZI9_9ACTN
MTEFLQLAFQGFSLGCTYALIGLGFVVIFRASNVLNFAQGAMLLVGAYLISWLAVDVGVPFLVAVLVAASLLTLGGAGFQAVVLRRVTGQPPFVIAMITIGAGIALVAGVEAIWGPEQRLLGDPWGSSSFQVGGVTIGWVKLWGIVVTAVAVAGYFAFDRYTRSGLAIRAIAGDEEATLSVGVPVRRMHAITWGLAGALATLGGLFLAGFPGAPQPTLGDAALRAFPAIVLGGLTSPVGAVIGGVVIGIVEVMTSGYAPDWTGANFYAVAPYIVMIAVLLVRPYGLLGRAPAERL